MTLAHLKTYDPLKSSGNIIGQIEIVASRDTDVLLVLESNVNLISTLSHSTLDMKYIFVLRHDEIGMVKHSLR